MASAKTPQTGADHEKERAARAALEACAGRPFSDLEWSRTRARLLEFAAILRTWCREMTTSESELRKAA
jgi:hypothetical protein